MLAFPKVKRKRATITIDYLDDLWRKCIRLEWGIDPFLTEYKGEVMQCHHIVERSDFLLRWDPKNGILLTIEHHNQVKCREWQDKIFALPGVDQEYLEEMALKDFKDYLFENGLCRTDFMLRNKQQLKDRIKVLGG